MKIALCCIGRLENQYAVEFVEWYKKLGFDRITIFDNNHEGEEHFEDVLQPYIDEKLVEIVPYRDRENAQMKAYFYCYAKYRYYRDYDWIAFFDFDEFLVLKNHSTIQEYLEWINTKGEFDCVKVNWMIYTDNNLVTNDGRPVNERFTTPMDYDKKVGFDFPQNNHTKSIVKCKADMLKMGRNPHMPIITKKICNADGIPTDNSSPFMPYTFENAYLKHFNTKTIEEFLCGKMARGLGDRTHSDYMKIAPINEFFKVNDMTPEKKKYLEENGLKFYDDKPKDNLRIFICTHKDIDPPVTSSVYQVVDNRKNKIKEHNGLGDKFYSEIITYYNIAEYEDLPPYVGFCHYRRYFSFLDNIPDMNDLFKKVDVFVTKPINFKISVRKQYTNFHNIEDLEIMEKIIREKYSEYSNAMETFLTHSKMFKYNMFIMKREDFKKYVEFIKNVLDAYIDIVGNDIEARVMGNQDKYFKHIEGMSQNDTLEYQGRIGAFLAERLTNIFFIHNFKRVGAVDVVITENKYNLKYNTI